VDWRRSKSTGPFRNCSLLSDSLVVDSPRNESRRNRPVSTKEIVLTIVLSLVGAGVSAGAGFKITRWVLFFWSGALVALVYGILGFRYALYSGIFLIICFLGWEALKRIHVVRPLMRCKLTKLPCRFRRSTPNLSEVALIFSNLSTTAANDVVAQLCFSVGWRRHHHIVDYGAWENPGRKMMRVTFSPGDTIPLAAFRLLRTEEGAFEVEALHRAPSPPTETSWMAGGAGYADFASPVSTIGRGRGLPKKVRLKVTLIGPQYRQSFRCTVKVNPNGVCGVR
jgi:hypothetical protein